MWAGRQSWSGETRMRRVDERAGRAFETGGLCCTARGSVCVRASERERTAPRTNVELRECVSGDRGRRAAGDARESPSGRVASGRAPLLSKP